MRRLLIVAILVMLVVMLTGLLAGCTGNVQNVAVAEQQALDALSYCKAGCSDQTLARVGETLLACMQRCTGK